MKSSFVSTETLATQAINPQFKYEQGYLAGYGISCQTLLVTFFQDKLKHTDVTTEGL